MSNPDVPDSVRSKFFTKVVFLSFLLGIGGMFLISYLPLPKLWKIIIGPEILFFVPSFALGLYWDNVKFPKEARAFILLYPAMLAWLIVIFVVRFAWVHEWEKAGIAALVMSIGAVSVYIPFFLARAISRRRRTDP